MTIEQRLARLERKLLQMELERGIQKREAPAKSQRELIGEQIRDRILNKSLKSRK